MHFPRSHNQIRCNSHRDRSEYLPTILPQSETFVSDAKTVPTPLLKSVKRFIAGGLVVIAFVALVCFGAYYYLKITDMNAIQGQYIVLFDKKHYSNHSDVKNRLLEMDKLGSTSDADFILLQEYINLDSLGLLSMSVKLSDSMHKSILNADGVVCIEPDLKIQLSTSCEVQTNPKW